MTGAGRSGSPGAAPVAVGDACTACGACIATCPEGALLPAPRLPRLAGSLCTGCFACLEICPTGAITEPKEAPG